ncbi:hypothetical protein ACOZ06_001819 [Cronobacter muytjensii]
MTSSTKIPSFCNTFIRVNFYAVQHRKRSQNNKMKAITIFNKVESSVAGRYAMKGVYQKKEINSHRESLRGVNRLIQQIKKTPRDGGVL